MLLLMLLQHPEFSTTAPFAMSSLLSVWNCPVAFVDVDYLDAIRIDLKAHTQLGNDINIGSLEFPAHKVTDFRSVTWVPRAVFVFSLLSTSRGASWLLSLCVRSSHWNPLRDLRWKRWSPRTRASRVSKAFRVR